MKLFRFLVVALLFFIMTRGVVAAPNNIYGIHLAQPHLEDLRAAADLVNANGGKWGYVTMVIQENDRDREKWQNIFDQLRKLHLIPIIRLATQPEGENWRRPEKEDINNWVDFLDSLNWVVKDRYLILFNEPNHGSEWGGRVDPENYAQLAFTFASKLKEKNPDFFVMLAGLDASAPSLPPSFEEEAIFLRNVFNYVSPEQFDSLFSGFVSHSYPNPDFSGQPWEEGRGTIKTYQWELNLLKQLGINKELPVFITETGWKHRVNNQQSKTQNLLDEKTVGEYFQKAFEEVWKKDDRIKAVTPFVLDYQSDPFLDFSWKKPKSNEFYQQYYTIQSLPKVKGSPDQIEKGEIRFNLPDNLLSQSSYRFSLQLKNSGQGYWDENSGYQLMIDDQQKSINILFSEIKDLKPFGEEEIWFFINTGQQPSQKNFKFILQKNGEKILESKNWRVNILPLPSLKLKVNLFPKINDKGGDFEIQIFDKEQTMVFREKNQEIFGGKGLLKNIRNVVIGKKYRVVILKPYYLPRQNFIVFQAKDNQINFRPMMPLDFNVDGRFSLADGLTFFKNPHLWKLFFP